MTVSVTRSGDQAWEAFGTEASSDAGSIAIGLAVVGFVLACMAAVGAVGVGIATRTQAASAADAAALAAAPVTFAPFGGNGTPTQEAAAYAARNGTRLVRCICAIDRSWRTRTVTVEVVRSVSIFGIGAVGVRASSTATFEPAALIPAE